MGGLGFHFKWNMGWMHDILDYFQRDPVHRRFHHGSLTFPLMYAWSENFILPLSHDEVVHGKRSLIGKMPGPAWQKAANLRLLYSYMYAQPGKKLLFMGSELGQRREFSEERELDWNLLEEPRHAGIQSCVRDLNRLYRDLPSLHQRDHDPRGFEWIDCADADHSIVSFVRRAADTGDFTVCVFNFTPVARHHYEIGAPEPGEYREIYNSDAAVYGGTNTGNGGTVRTQPRARHHRAQSLSLTLPPLGAVFFRLAR